MGEREIERDGGKEGEREREKREGEGEMKRAVKLQKLMLAES